MKKTITKIILALLAVLVLIPLGGGAAFRTPSINSVAQPYAFSAVSWSLSNVSTEIIHRISQKDDYGKLTEDEKLKLVRDYLALGESRGRLEYRLMRLENRTDDAAQTEKQILQEQLSQIISAMEPNTFIVERIISEKLSDILKEEEIDLTSGIIFPPVTFSFAKLPFLLVISPRDKIYLQDSQVLRPDLTSAEITEIEQRLEAQGYSASVERVGGISTYPSMIPDNASHSFILSTVVHEWAHQYFFFHPLGWNYNDSYEMRIINETAADIVGNELGSKIVKVFYGEEKTNTDTQEPDKFNFNQKMHNIRLTVDQYLQEGKIEEAEQYMTIQRQYLEDNGYYIRKINQAYFAWHGSYADSPGSISPIGEQLHALRDRSGSLKEFMKIISGIDSPSDLTALNIQK